MKKVVIHTPGGHDELRVETHPDLEVGPGEVRVAVEAIGVNYADCIVRMGLYQSARDYVGYPITPGFEVAGRVDAVGEGVDGLEVGEVVVAVTRFFGYASQVVVPAAQALRLPDELGVVDAAAFPTAHLTAWYALRELAHPRSGSILLVHSAAGGVGGALCQIGKAVGCRVVGVVGAPHKVEVALERGADVVIDKSRQDLWAAAREQAPDGYDVVLDANGPATLAASYDHLAPGGRLVVYGFHSMLSRDAGRPSWARLAVGWLRIPRFDPLAMTNDNKSVLAFNLSYLFDRTDLYRLAMRELFGWVSAGALRPAPVETRPLDRVADAHRALESGQTVGKLVLIP